MFISRMTENSDSVLPLPNDEHLYDLRNLDSFYGSDLHRYEKAWITSRDFQSLGFTLVGSVPIHQVPKPIPTGPGRGWTHVHGRSPGSEFGRRRSSQAAVKMTLNSAPSSPPLDTELVQAALPSTTCRVPHILGGPHQPSNVNCSRYCFAVFKEHRASLPPNQLSSAAT